MRQVSLYFQLWIKFSLRHLLNQRWRTITVLIGIALGAAVFTSVRIAVNASVDSFNRSMDLLSGNADWVVVNPGGRAPDSLVAALLKHPAVRTASPLLTEYVQVETSPGNVLLLIGLDPILERSLRDWDMEQADSGSQMDSWLSLIAEPNTILVGSKITQKLDAIGHDRISLTDARSSNSFRIVGVLEPKGAALIEGGEIAVIDISTFQEFTGLRGLVDRIDIRLKPNATEKDLGEIRAMLPDGIRLTRPAELKTSGRMMIRAYELNLSILSFVALFVGMFLVYSLVALHATARRRELAILRSIGASSSMLFFLFIAEGAFFGVAGWVVATPLSSYLVKALLGGISSTISHLFVRVKVENATVSPFELVASFLITLLVSILAALQPAREAMRVPPREALVMLDAGPKARNVTPKLAMFGLLLIFLAFPLSKLPPSFGIPISGYIATFCLFCGFSLLSPLFMQLIGNHLPPLLRRMGGYPAYLGCRYMRDAGSRVAISTGALVTAVALFVALSIMIHSFRETVKTWVEQSITGDLFLTPKMAELNQYKDPIPKEVVTVLHSLETPVDLLPYRRIRLRYDGVPYQFEAIDMDVFLKHAEFLLVSGDSSEITPKLLRGEGVLISEVLANKTGLRGGMHYRANVEGVHLDLPILGIARDYRTHGGVVHFSLRRFVSFSGDPSWSGVRIYLRGESNDAAIAGLRNEILRRSLKLGQEVDLTVGKDLRREILRIFDETFSITSVLLVIALLVAAMGITTTLAVLVLERSRELHTLVAAGATKGQVLSMLTWEAVLMVLSGQLLGVSCGIVLSHLLIFVINRQSFGWTFIISADWPSLLVSFPLVFATSLFAALPASWVVFNRSSAFVLRE
jgi:putative ABC transport system permease protein